MSPFVELLLGAGLAFGGGELFLRGVLGVSAWLRVPKSVTAATFAAFATSSPEISVAIGASVNGESQIALGDALGSNIVNVALILGLAMTLGPMQFAWKDHRREWWLAVLVPIGILVVLWDGWFSRTEGWICLAFFSLWLASTIRDALMRRSEVDETTIADWTCLAYSAAGVGFLILAGRLIVSGAVKIGTALEMDPFLVGATMVAIGTSAPELATAVVSKLRGHDEVGVGTILGSNVFNCLFIVGLAAVIGPFHEPVSHVAASVGFGVAAVLLIAPWRGPTLGRVRGLVLLALYGASIVVAWRWRAIPAAH